MVVASGPQGSSKQGDAVTDQLLVDAEEAARRIGIGRTKMYELLGQNEIESVAVGRRRLVPTTALDEYVQRLRAQDRDERRLAHETNVAGAAAQGASRASRFDQRPGVVGRQPVEGAS